MNDTPTLEPVLNPNSAMLAQSMLNLISANQILNKAIEDVPNYTGQWTREDYFRDEQAGYNRAAEEFAKSVKLICHGDSLQQ